MYVVLQDVAIVCTRLGVHQCASSREDLHHYYHKLLILNNIVSTQYYLMLCKNTLATYSRVFSFN